ncbi:MAG: GMC family oxidoreductase [Bacteroidetes bacterium]|nr:GMC family oxidoreductase [Bacteroidota bacterium]MBL6944258.1 GMC family oxidoreductase [Bacteroidales bacterium]
MTNKLSSMYDYIIIGSGFGGSVCALRLSEKGYKVLVIEKGRWWNPNEFPKTNWNLKKWLWLPSLRFFGFFKLTFLRHVGILSGVGVGGGSLVYANTLPRPRNAFFNSGSWANIKDWKLQLEPHYLVAEKMLGAIPNPQLFDADIALKQLAKETNCENSFEPTNVGVFFGEPEKTVADPYFEGNGPEREGCRFCGACMTGCPHNAKNSLDKNYLYLAIKNGTEIIAKHNVTEVVPTGNQDGSDGYTITFQNSFSLLNRKKHKVKSRGVVFSGGVLGTIRLLLNMKEKHLNNLSDKTGFDIRTNNESLISVVSKEKLKDYSKGIAIGSIFPSDENSHIEPVRYGEGSNFWKLMGVPLTHGSNIFVRAGKLIYHLLRHPLSWLRVYFTKNFSQRSIILLFMQHLDSTVRFKKDIFTLTSRMTEGEAPSAFIPEAKELADKTANIINGKPFVLLTEALTGIPTTAHILGGAVIGKTSETGVIDENQKVFGYENMYVCDGSAISANPGVNPALTITAMTELAMSKITGKA